MIENEYILEPTSPTLSITIDMVIEEVGAECATPEITGLAHEGSWYVVLEANGVSDGISVDLNTGDTGVFIGQKAVIELSQPLTGGQEIYAFIDSDECKTRSCTIRIPRLLSNELYCDYSDLSQIPGLLTGKFVCVEKDLYAQMYDGEGGVYAGELVQESCIVCGGINPNCDEVPTVVYYNMVKCSTGFTYQATSATPIIKPNQRVSHPVHGVMRWDNTSITSSTQPQNYIGDITITENQTGCPSAGGGGGGSTYYNLVSCANGQIYQTNTQLSFPNQRVSHGTHGELYWNGSTTSVQSNFIGSVNPLAETGCSGGGGGGTTYYEIVSCAGGGVYQTPTVLTSNGQRVSTGLGEHFWNGNTTNTATHLRNSSIMRNPDGSLIYGCS